MAISERSNRVAYGDLGEIEQDNFPGSRPGGTRGIGSHLDYTIPEGSQMGMTKPSLPGVWLTPGNRTHPAPQASFPGWGFAFGLASG